METATDLCVQNQVVEYLPGWWTTASIWEKLGWIVADECGGGEATADAICLALGQSRKSWPVILQALKIRRREIEQRQRTTERIQDEADLAFRAPSAEKSPGHRRANGQIAYPLPGQLERDEAE